MVAPLGMMLSPMLIVLLLGLGYLRYGNGRPRPAPALEPALVDTCRRPARAGGGRLRRARFALLVFDQNQMHAVGAMCPQYDGLLDVAGA